MKIAIFVFLAIYVFGIYKFLSGIDRTNFTQNKIVLALLWPVLYFNKSYRQNFNKALKG